MGVVRAPGPTVRANRVTSGQGPANRLSPEGICSRPLDLSQVPLDGSPHLSHFHALRRPTSNPACRPTDRSDTRGFSSRPRAPSTAAPPCPPNFLPPLVHLPTLLHQPCGPTHMPVPATFCHRPVGRWTHQMARPVTASETKRLDFPVPHTPVQRHPAHSLYRPLLAPCSVFFYTCVSLSHPAEQAQWRFLGPHSNAFAQRRAAGTAGS